MNWETFRACITQIFHLIEQTTSLQHWTDPKAPTTTTENSSSSIKYTPNIEGAMSFTASLCQTSFYASSLSQNAVDRKEIWKRAGEKVELTGIKQHKCN